jgi:hypothetical protein
MIAQTLLFAILIVNSNAQNYYINILNALVRSNMAQINSDIRGGIPNSYGACSQNNPPPPCQCAPCMTRCGRRENAFLGFIF